MTVEGEKDDISGVGQTYAAQELCVNIPAAMKQHYLQLEVGHYGVFNGSRFREEIAPRIRKFIATIEESRRKRAAMREALLRQLDGARALAAAAAKAQGSRPKAKARKAWCPA